MTPTPRLVALLAALAGPLVLAGRWPQVATVVAGLDALLLALLLVDALDLSRSVELTGRRRHAGRLSLGEDNPVAVELESRTPFRLVGRLTDGVGPALSSRPVALPVDIPPFGRAELAYVLRPTGRGDFAFGDLFVRLRGRLGLAAVDWRIAAAGPVGVHPNLVEVARYRFLAHSHRRRLVGRRSRAGAVQGREFEELRDYTPGDDYRTIDWKATAKRRRPVTQRFRPERSQNVVLAIDGGRMMATRIGELAKLDLAVNAALMLGAAALDGGDNVGLAVFSDRLDHFLAPTRGRAAMARILDTLHGVRARYTAVDFRAVMVSLAARLRRRSLVVLWTDLIDEEEGETLLASVRVLRPRHLPLIVTMADGPLLAMAGQRPGGIEDVYGRAVARRILDDRARKIAALQSQGVRILEARPEELSARTVERYHELKRSGAL